MDSPLKYLILPYFPFFCLKHYVMIQCICDKMKAVVSVLKGKAKWEWYLVTKLARSEQYAPRILSKMVTDIPSRQNDCNGGFQTNT